MKKRVYLDYAAATPVDARVLAAMQPFCAVQFANPSAIHKEGVAVRLAVDKARKSIALGLGIHEDELVFTGSATESANLALAGAVSAWKKKHPDRIAHVVVSAIEHDAVLLTARKLKESGVRVTFLPVSPNGIVRIEALKQLLTKNTVLVSVMYANNEVGTMQPIREIAKIIRKRKKELWNVARDQKLRADEPYPLFHTDATQAANYCEMHIPRLGVDMLTMNAAKIYGPKGVGLLAVCRGAQVEPLIFGGGHEGGFRAGTENVPCIVGFAEAFRIAQKTAVKESRRLAALRDYAIMELKKNSEIQCASNIPNSAKLPNKGEPCVWPPLSQTSYSRVVINGDETVRLPNNINFSVPGIDHEFLAMQLDARGFAVATKSACNENESDNSHVLAALRDADSVNCTTSGIRLSFGRCTSKKDVAAFLNALRDIQKIKRIVI